jgi:hypothetical protein
VTRYPFDHRMAPPVWVPLKRWPFDLFWGLLTLLAVAVAAGVALTSRTTGGRLVGGGAFGLLAVACLAGWFDVRRHPPQLQVSGETITHSYKGREDRVDRIATLYRVDGPDIGFVLVRRQRGAHWSLAQPGNPITVDVRHFRVPDLLAACETRGWRVMDGAGPRR